ncbi:hypothetical protein ACHAXR_011811 [Thalassiosira sp. AJA248-18]
MADSKPNMAQNNGKSSNRKDSSSVSDRRPYNHYNLYFILERELFLQERGVYPSTNHDGAVRSNSAGSHMDYSGIDLPPLPSRYSSLFLPEDWYVHKKRKRSHVKTHGLVSFREMASMVASRWRQEDDEIILFLKTVAAKVKQRFEELKKLSPCAADTKSPTVFRPSPINVPINEERSHSMTSFPRDVTLKSNGQPGIHRVSAEHMRRGSFPISELDVSDEEIMSIWSSY